MTSNEMNMEKYFLVIRNHLRIVMGIFFVCVLLAGVITFFTPKMYTASILLNFDLKDATPMEGRGSTVLAEETYIETQVGIIKSQKVAEQVEKSLSDYEKNRFISALDAESTVFNELQARIKEAVTSIFEGSTDETVPVKESKPESLDVSSAYSWVARALGANLVVNPRFKSRIVEVTYSSTDPQIAALIANRFAEAYVDINLQMIIDPAKRTTAWFDSQSATLRKKLEDAQSALTAYQQQEGIVSSGERLNSEESRLEDLAKQLVEAQQATRNAVTEQQKLEEIKAKKGSLMSFDPVLSDSVIQNIKSEIRGLEGQIVGISSSLGKNHPRYKRLYSELSATRNRLDNEIKAILNGINNRAELAKARERDLSRSLGDQKQLVLDLKLRHDKISVLKRSVESAHETYNAALKEMNTTSLQSMIDQTDVSIIDRANVPKSHASPLLSLNLGLGAFVGLLLGIGTSLLMEMFVRRVHSREDILTELGIPLLGHLKKA